MYNNSAGTQLKRKCIWGYAKEKCWISLVYSLWTKHPKARLLSTWTARVTYARLPTYEHGTEVFWIISNVSASNKDSFQCQRYKVVQIWPGQTVNCLHTNSPGHIWTTLCQLNPVSFDTMNFSKGLFLRLFFGLCKWSETATREHVIKCHILPSTVSVGYSQTAAVCNTLPTCTVRRLLRLCGIVFWDYIFVFIVLWDFCVVVFLLWL